MFVNLIFEFIICLYVFIIVLTYLNTFLCGKILCEKCVKARANPNDFLTKSIQTIAEINDSSRRESKIE